jgi:translocation and assembly module TamB
MARRWGKGLGIALASLLGLAALTAAALFVAAGSESVRDWLLREAEAALAADGVELAVGRLEGNLLTGLELEEVSLSWGGRTPLAARRLEFRVSLPALLGGRIRVARLRLAEPRVRLPLDWPEGEGGGREDGGGLPLTGLSLPDIQVTGGFLHPGGAWGPLEALQGLEVGGRLVWDSRGLDIRARVAAGRALLAGGRGEVALEGRARLEDRELSLQRLHLARGDSRLEARGRLGWDGGLGFRGRAVGSLDPADLPWPWPGPRLPAGAFELDLALEGAPAAARLTARLSRGEGRLSVRGPVDLTKPAGRLELKLERLDPRAWGLSPLAGRVSGTGRLASPGPGPDGPRASLGLDLADLALALPQGRVAARSLDLAAELARGELAVTTLEAAGPWGRVAVQGRLRLPAGGEPAEVQAEAGFSGLSPPGVLAGLLPAGLDQAKLEGRLTARGPWTSLELELELGPSRLLPGLEVESLAAKGRRQAGGWRLTRLEGRGPWGSLGAGGRLDAAGAELDFSLQAPSLARAMEAARAAGVEGLPRLSGAVEASGRLSGPWGAPGLSLAASGRELEGLETRAEEMELTVQARGLPWPQGKAVLEARAVASGDQRVKRLRLEAQATSRVTELNLQAVGAAGWDLGLSLEAGRLRSWPLPLRLRRLRLQRPGRAAWVQDGPAKLWLGPRRVEVQGLAVSSQGQRLALDGRWLGGDRLEAALQAEGLRLEPLAPDSLPDSARLAARARLQGRLSQPVLSLEGKVTGLAWPKLPESEVSFQGGYQDNLLRLEGSAVTGGCPCFDLTASLGVDLSLHPPRLELTERGLEARASSDNLPLALLEPVLPGVAEIGGESTMRVSAKGSLAAPRLQGFLEVSQGRFAIPATGQRFEGVELRLDLEGERVRVSRAVLHSGGRLEVSGWLEPPLDGAGRVDLTATARELELGLGVLGRATTGAEISITGELLGPRVRGTVRPSSLYVHVGMGPPEDLEEVVVLEPGQKPPPLTRQSRKRPWNPDGFLGRTDIEAVVDVSHGLRVRLDNGWLQASGSLTFRKPRREPATYHGVITVNRGLILILGKRFEVQRGKVDFGGRKLPNPDLSGAALVKTGGTRIRINVSGPAEDPNVQLSSEPPMAQADILSALIFGKPAATLNQSQQSQLSGQALALLGQEGAQRIAALLSPELAPDVVTVHSEAARGSSLEAGKYLNEDLYLRYRHNLGPQGGQNVGLEYRITDWLSLESQLGDARDSGVDVIYNLDFD